MTIGRQVISLVKDWNTPPEYVEAVKTFFGGVIHLDPCSNMFSVVKAEVEYLLPESDGLVETWDYPTIYVNPPYGRDKGSKTSIKDWLQRCTDAHKSYGSEVVALIPVATNTRHWQNNIFIEATSVCFLKVPRLKFLLDGKPVEKGSPMACCLVYWGEHSLRFEEAFTQFGKVLHIFGGM